MYMLNFMGSYFRLNGLFYGYRISNDSLTNSALYGADELEFTLFMKPWHLNKNKINTNFLSFVKALV